MNEIARNNPKDQLTDRSFNNQCGSHMSIKKRNKKKDKPKEK